jgi:hypothetical protein
MLLDNLPTLGTEAVPLADLHFGLRSSEGEKAWAIVLRHVRYVFNHGDGGPTAAMLKNQPHVGRGGRIAWVETLEQWRRTRPDRSAELRRLMAWVLSCPD